MLYTIKDSIEVPISLKEAWDFFSNAENLELITPPSLAIKITCESKSKIHAGQIISYQVSPFLGIPLLWVTEITHLSEGHFFIDEQRVGPYRMWHHRHSFKETENGTLIEDVVDYVLPLGYLGDLIHFLFVKKQVTNIFSYRKLALQKRFSSKG